MPSNSTAATAHCPHCQLVIAREVEPPYPTASIRCPHCQLVVGAGRARPEAALRPGARGAAAGVLSSAARRAEVSDGFEEQAIRLAIRSVAAILRKRAGAVGMVDYQELAAADASLPSVNEVLHAFGTWKNARAQPSLEST